MKGKRGGAASGGGGGGLMKRIMNALSSKTNELRTRAMIFFLLHRNGLFMMDKFRSLSHHRLLRRQHHRSRRRRSGSSIFLQHEDDVDVDNINSTNSDEGRSTRASLMHMINNNNHHHNRSEILAYTTTQGASDDLINMRDEEKHDMADLTNDLFEQSKEVIRLSTDKVSKADGDGEEQQQQQKVVVVEEEEEEEDIDLAADLFIQRFRRQIQLQKQLSLNSHTQIMVPQMV